MSRALEDESLEHARLRGRLARDLTLLIALTLGLHAPFIGQAFHLDDVQYLDIAKNVYRNPFFPLDLPYVFQGSHTTLLKHTHPPLNSYLIAGLLLFHHRSPSEIFLHSWFLGFPVLATIAFYFLSRRFVRHALLAAVILATNPILMVSTHTLMADVPLLGLWLCGTALFLKGVDENRRSLLYVSGITITAAFFYAYQALALFPLLAFYALGRNRLRTRELVVLCAPLVLMAGWQFSNYLHGGVIYASPMLENLGDLGLWQGGTKIRTAIATLTYLGGSVLLFPFIFARMGKAWKGMLVFTGVAIGIWVAYDRLAGYTMLQKAFFVACFAAGVTAVLWAIIRGFDSWSVRNWGSDNMFLCLWFIGILAGCVLAFFSGSARYLLPACPPLLLLLIREDERSLKRFSHGRKFYVCLITAQLALGLAMAQSDYEFAGMGRQEARYFQSRHLDNGQPFLFSGEWGFRYYLTAMGGEIMAQDTTAAPGELVVKSRLCLGRTFGNKLERSLELIEERSYRIRSPLRLLDEHSHSGFWSDGWGVLPFWFSREKLDDLYVYRVRDD